VSHARLGKPPPPLDLQLAWMCGDNHLPADGGVLEQDAGLMARMATLRNTHRLVTKYYSLKGVEINTRLSPSERVALKELDELGLLGGIGG